jgi:hypothetical protein
MRYFLPNLAGVASPSATGQAITTAAMAEARASTSSARMMNAQTATVTRPTPAAGG